MKEAGKALFAPERGGGYEVWERRPMPRELLEYAAAADVAHLRAMWREWGHSRRARKDGRHRREADHRRHQGAG